MKYASFEIINSEQVLSFPIHSFEIGCLLNYQKKVLQKYIRYSSFIRTKLFTQLIVRHLRRCFAAYPTIDVTGLPKCQTSWWGKANSRIAKINNNVLNHEKHCWEQPIFFLVCF